LVVRILSVLIVLVYLQKYSVAIILFIWIFLYVVINYYYAVFKLKYDAHRVEVDSEVSGRLADTITNNSTIRQFASLKTETNFFKTLTQKQLKVSRLAWLLSELAETIQVVMMVLIEFGIFYLAVKGWERGFINIGDFVLIQAYLIQLFNNLWGFGRIIRRTYESFADAEEMTEILNQSHEIIDKPKAKTLAVTNGEIIFSNIDFTYNQTRYIMKNFNLSIKPGEKIGLVGSSGAGKSTLVSLLFRNFEVINGSIMIDNQNIADVTQESLRAQISLVPQDPVLFHRTLKENIGYGKSNVTEEQIIQASKAAHCHDFIKNLSQGYNTLVGERGIKLSGGERQRVAIARAIIKNTPILVLDEATSSLNSHSELLIQDALAKLMDNKTVIVIAHRLSTLLKMDRIVVIEDGQIAEMGSHVELLQQPGSVYKHLWELQAGGFLAD